MPDWGWLFFAYCTGSIATALILWKTIAIRMAETTIDTLIENGFLRWKKLPGGDIEILKWNDNSNV